MTLRASPRSVSRSLATGSAPMPSALQRSSGTLHLRIAIADIAKLTVPVAVVGRYLGTPVGGAMRGFDRALNGWLQQAIERGVIGSLLGELAFVPIPEGAAGALKLLVVGGMGEYGRFTRDDLAYLATNVTLSVCLLEHREFATVLIGAGNQGMPPARSARAIAEGALAAFDHFPAGPGRAAPELTITFATRHPEAAREVSAELDLLKSELAASTRKATNHDTVTVETLKPPRGRTRSNLEHGSEPRESGQNRVTITRLPTVPGERPPMAPAMATLEYAALTSSAVIPVRKQQVQEFYLQHIPDRVKAATEPLQQQRMGELLSRYLIPADLQPVIHGGNSLTLILDPAMAAIPWEMACYQRLGMPRFYGTQLNLTRQFRTAQTTPPGIAPPVNAWLNVLIIADPAGGTYALPGARAEANAVLRALGKSRLAWGGKLRISVTVRVGPPGTPQAVLDRVLDGVDSGLLANVAPPDSCDPLEILALLLNDGFDVVHFAGHGEFDRDAGRVGWVFDDGFLLTATDALKVARVPRLVFANACHSAELAGNPKPMPETHEMVGLAEAFFQQGIENYIGTGWEVDDVAAQQFATTFYHAALGRETDGQQLARAAALAREAIFTAGAEQGAKANTWGAYQYYGQPTARLFRVGGEN